MFTAIIYEMDEDGDYVVKNPSASDSIFVLAKVDFVPDNYANMQILLEKLDFPLKNRDIKFTFDIKLLCIALGNQSTSSLFCCPFGSCFRLGENKKGDVVVTNHGRWVLGLDASPRLRQEWYEAWMDETGGDPAQLRKYNSQKSPPLQLFDEEFDEVPYIELCSPMPLHLLLGESHSQSHT